MLSNRSVLLNRINFAINKKWFLKTDDLADTSGQNEKTNGQNEIIDRKFFSLSGNSATIKRLEHRLEALEKQNDQLLYFINVLVEHLPEQMARIFQDEQDLKKIQEDSDQLHVNRNDLPDSLCRAKNDYPCPTRREKDVLELLVKGFCAKEIANSLFISETTVVTHKKNLKEKFNAKNTVELISKAQSQLPSLRL